MVLLVGRFTGVSLEELSPPVAGLKASENELTQPDVIRYVMHMSWDVI